MHKLKILKKSNSSEFWHMQSLPLIPFSVCVALHHLPWPSRSLLYTSMFSYLLHFLVYRSVVLAAIVLGILYVEVTQLLLVTPVKCIFNNDPEKELGDTLFSQCE